MLLFLLAVMVEGDESGWLTSWWFWLATSPYWQPWRSLFIPGIHAYIFHFKHISSNLGDILSLCVKTSYSYLSASKTTNMPWQKEKTSGSKILYTHNIINRNDSMSLSLSHYHTVWTYRLPSILVKKLQRSVVMLRTTNCCVTAEKLHKRKQNLYLLYIYESCSHLILLQLPFNTLLDLHYSSDDTQPHSIIVNYFVSHKCFTCLVITKKAWSH